MRVTIGALYDLLIKHFDSGSFCVQFTCLLVFSLNVKCICDECDFVQTTLCHANKS